MNVSESDFFREVSLRICSSLDLKKALWQVFLYVRKIMPADELFLTTYHRGLDVLEVVAWADLKGSEDFSVKVSMLEIRKTMIGFAAAALGRRFRLYSTSRLSWFSSSSAC